MNFYLSTEQQDKVKENERLVRYILNKLSIPYNDYDDAFQDGIFGLMKGIVSFDSNKTANFSTYVTRCITNEIFMGFRKNKKYKDVIFFEDVVRIGRNGECFTIGDTIFDESIKDFDEKIINSELISEYMNVVLNCLSATEKIVLLYKMVGIPQNYIAMVLNVCQSYVSRLGGKAQAKVQKIIDRKQIYNKKFTFKLSDEIFEIKFYGKDSNNTKEKLESFLSNIKIKLKLSEFKIICKEDYIVIYLQATQESFIYVAEIINRVNDEKLSYKRDSTLVILEYERDKKEAIMRISNNKNVDSMSNKKQEIAF